MQYEHITHKLIRSLGTTLTLFPGTFRTFYQSANLEHNKNNLVSTKKKMMRVKLKDESHRQTWIIGRRGRSPGTVRQGKWPAICILTDSLLASFLLHESLRLGLIRLKRFVFMSVGVGKGKFDRDFWGKWAV